MGQLGGVVTQGDDPYLRASQDAAKEYDARIFWLAGGAITLTFALAKSLAGQRSLVSVPWLAVGIGLFVAGLVAAMVSHQFTIQACNAWFEHQNVAQSDADRSRLAERAVRYTRGINILNWIALAAVVGGIACVSVFAIHNLTKGATSDAGAQARAAAHTAPTTTTAAAHTAAAGSATRSQGLATSATAAKTSAGVQIAAVM